MVRWGTCFKQPKHWGLFNPLLWWRNLKSAGFWYVSPMSVKVLEKNQHIGKAIPADRKLFLDTPITWSLEKLLFILPNDSTNYRFFSHFWVHFETFLQLFLISFSFSSFLQTHTHTLAYTFILSLNLFLQRFILVISTTDKNINKVLHNRHIHKIILNWANKNLSFEQVVF